MKETLIQTLTHIITIIMMIGVVIYMAIDVYRSDFKTKIIAIKKQHKKKGKQKRKHINQVRKKCDNNLSYKKYPTRANRKKRIKKQKGKK